MKNLFKKYSYLDILYKIKDSLFDLLLLFYWKIRLNKIGKHSRIKKGLIVIGSGKRIKIGHNFKIWHRCLINVKNGKVIIGSNGLIGTDTIINASKGKVIIGNNVAIAPKVQIFSYSHHYKKNKNTNECYKIADIEIRDNVLIGAGAIILPGVTIGNGAIVAAGAVVSKSIQNNCIVGGIPASLITRKE